MKVAEIRRQPIKSLLGEAPPAAVVGRRGLDGDRFGDAVHARLTPRLPSLTEMTDVRP